MRRCARFPVAASVVGVLLAIGTAVTALGRWHQSWHEALAIKGPGLSAGYLYFLAVCALLLLSTPLTVLVGCSVYVEAFWSACLLAGALWLFKAALTWNLPYRVVFSCEEFGGGQIGGSGFIQGGRHRDSGASAGSGARRS